LLERQVWQNGGVESLIGERSVYLLIAFDKVENQQFDLTFCRQSDILRLDLTVDNRRRLSMQVVERFK
jgi:hypothetical protein